MPLPCLPALSALMMAAFAIAAPLSPNLPALSPGMIAALVVAAGSSLSLACKDGDGSYAMTKKHNLKTGAKTSLLSGSMLYIFFPSA